MVESVVRPVSWSTGKPLKGVRPVSAYAPYKKLAGLLTMLRSEEEEEQAPSRKESPSRENLAWVEQALESDGEAILDLMFDREYQEMVRFFLTPNYDEILSIRSRIRQGVPDSESGITSNVKHSVQQDSTGRDFSDFAHTKSPTSPEQRDQLYRIQMQLYETPKGVHCHVIV